ncbi:hypothetical protein, partial [Pseudomonas viridiflava]|uniref:hypothetical protein n=1 Tax=Pseudomonas viridiflava TaxID=33069 RepID=UPI001980641F
PVPQDEELRPYSIGTVARVPSVITRRAVVSFQYQSSLQIFHWQKAAVNGIKQYQVKHSLSSKWRLSADGAS